MVLLNAAKRARMASSTVNQDQGGGETKAGLPYIVGRTASSSRALDPTHVGGCSVANMAKTFTFPNAPRPVGVVGNAPRMVIRF